MMESIKIKGTIYNGSFWEAISPVLRCSQIFGIIPLKSFGKKSTKTLHFSWFSAGVLVCLIFMVWDVLVIYSYLQYNRNNRINAGMITTLLFHSMGFCIYAAFLHLARHWVNIMTDWTHMEQRFLKAPYITKSSQKLKGRLIAIGITIAMLSVVEHALFQGSKLYKFYGRGIQCNITDRGVGVFFAERFPYVNELMPNGIALALSQLVSVFGTAAWNFLDLFIVLVSIGISTRFEQLTKALREHLDNGASDSKTMLRFRLDFIAICDLLAYVDSHMGIVVFLSAVNNLYFVSSQLLFAFNPLHYLIEYVYYWYSLFYLLSRTLYLFITAAGINEAAVGPKVLLHNISSDNWTEESSRFLFQINSRTIALSAMGFCNFTRRLILTMAGAIVTFELVMMQFNRTSGPLPSLCVK